MPNGKFLVTLRHICLSLALAPLAACDFVPGPVLPDGYFQLTTQTGDESGLCLESTNYDAAIGAVMKPCSNSAAQLWLAKHVPEGGYMLTSRAREKHDECLESTSHAHGGVLMDPCGYFTGQVWLINRLGDNVFKLTSEFRQLAKECLSSGESYGGANMDPCMDTPDQAWQVKLSS